MKQFLILPVCLLAALSSAEAQAPKRGPTVVTLVAASLPSGARVEVRTRVKQVPHNIILVDPQATALDLASAVALFNGVRLRNGDYPTKNLNVRPVSFTPEAGWDSSHRLYFEQRLEALRKAGAREIQGVGASPSLDITVQAGNGSFR